MTELRPLARRAIFLCATSVAAMAGVNGLDLPLTARRLEALAGGEPILDLRLGYGPEEAWGLLDRLGDAGRSGYLAMLWSVDLLLPALFGATLWSALGAGRLARLRWLALLATGADYLENVALTALLSDHPARHGWLAQLTAGLTVAKFALYAAAAFAAVAGALAAGILARRREPHAGADRP